MVVDGKKGLSKRGYVCMGEAGKEVKSSLSQKEHAATCTDVCKTPSLSLLRQLLIEVLQLASSSSLVLLLVDLYYYY